MRSLLSFSFLVLGLAIVFMPGNAYAKNNMLIILDASNSMWGQIDDTAKIETARGVLGDLVSDLPENMNVGLMAYGHGDKESCTDVAILSPIAKLDADALKSSIKDIKPKGKTPIAYSIEKAGEALEGDKDATSNILLISDGIETCEGDPCAAAEKLASKNISTKVHVVGFDVDAEAKKQLECIAEKGNGKYFDAENAEGFKTALAEVKKEAVIEPKPEPEPVAEVYFKESFDGDMLADHWEVINPDPNNFIAEEGELLIVKKAGNAIAPNDETIPNLVQLSNEMPKGDWELEVKFTLEANVGKGIFYAGVRDDFEGWFASGVSTRLTATSCHVSVFNNKFEAGENTYFFEDTVKISDGYPQNWDRCKDAFAEKGQSTLIIRKEGRNYTTSISHGTEGTQKFEKIVLKPLKMLRGKSNVFLSLGMSENNHLNNGETSVMVDSIKVTAIK